MFDLYAIFIFIYGFFMRCLFLWIGRHQNDFTLLTGSLIALDTQIIFPFYIRQYHRSLGHMLSFLVLPDIQIRYPISDT